MIEGYSRLEGSSHYTKFLAAIVDPSFARITQYTVHVEECLHVFYMLILAHMEDNEIVF